MNKQLYSPRLIRRAILPLLACTLLLGACQKKILGILNPNLPTPQGSLVTEGGIDAFAEGIFYKWIAFETGDGNLNFFDIAWYIESNMGDEDFTPYSNYGSRYPMNIASITLPAPYNTVVNNPSGFATQLDILRSFNSRSAGDGNAIQYEWDCFYYVNAQANILLNALDNPALKLSGDATTKKALLQAWAYYWKGYAYSKLGSMYLAAVIDDSPDSTVKSLTSNIYVAHDQVIAAANKNFNQAASLFSGITEDADYDATFRAIIPSFNAPTQVITPTMWVHQINSFEARDYLVNHKVDSMTSADWNNVLTLATAGMQQGDHTLMWGVAPAGVPDLTQNLGFLFHPMMLHTPSGALSFVSERLIQDIQPGDARLNYFEPYPTGTVVNVLNRGIQFGTRYAPVDIENGGRYATENFSSQALVPIAPTWEENALMIAECNIYLGNVDAGLQLIDQVRASQGAGLPVLAGSGMSQDSAIAQLRSERRIGLYLHNVSWYDARRWGITAPAAQGGGRIGNIVVPGSLIGANSYQVLPCFINYSFSDYWDVPKNETDFNPPAAGSAPVAN
ncbi:MAG TPA: RagB/SusD family nutrient uptake outer membrane protein [Puia sp.]|nr:RagB/SusD family nutrient uptake outer membrane protein [Puia sp.]